MDEEWHRADDTWDDGADGVDVFSDGDEMIVMTKRRQLRDNKVTAMIMKMSRR